MKEVFVIAAYYLDKSGASIVAVVDDKEQADRYVAVASCVGSAMQLVVYPMQLNAISPRDIF